MSTPSTERLLDLAARCEAETGPNRELDRDIADAVLGPVKAPYVRGKCESYTASLDAAMQLAGNNLLVGMSDIHADGLPGCSLCSDTSTNPPTEHHGVCFDGRNATREQKLALALTAAALRSLAEEGEGK